MKNVGVMQLKMPIVTWIVMTITLKEKTRVVYGEDETTKLILQTVNNARSRWDNYADSNGPTIAMGLEQLRKGMRNAQHRRGKNILEVLVRRASINYCTKIAEVFRYGRRQRGNGCKRNGIYCYEPICKKLNLFPP